MAAFAARLGDVSLYVLAASFWAASQDSMAGDSLAAVMSRMSAPRTVQIAYSETRYLELFEKPWQGSGYFYSQPPDHLIKLQLRPSRVIMAVKANRMLYYDSVNQVRHNGIIQDDDPSGALVSTLRAIVSGDQVRLESVYVLDFDSQPGQWSLVLTPKKPSASFDLPEFVVTGKPGGTLETIGMRQADGDRSEITLGKLSEGNAVSETIGRLLDEAEGN